MQFTPAGESRAYRTVIDQVRDAIMTRDLKVGDLLPSEREVASQLGISRTSVREAIRVLADAGLVSRRAGAGGGTRIIGDVIPVALLGRAIELSRQRIMDMLEVRSVLELTAAELAAVRATPELVANLEQIVRRAHAAIELSPNERDLFTSVESMFHLAVARAAQNEALLRLNRISASEVAVALDLIPLHTQKRWEFEQTELSSMAAVVDAIRRRNPTQARAAMSIHLSHFPPIVEQYFREE